MSRRTLLVTFAATACLLIVPIAAFASDRFTDVPDSNIQHDDISWLADAGVTLGCNPPTNDNFCPNDSVTHGQMAAIIRRFSAFLDVDAAVGRSSAVGYVTDDIGETLTTGASTLLTLQIDAPADGFLIVDGMVNIVASGAGASVNCWIGLDSTTSTRAHTVQDQSVTVHEWTDTRGFDVTAGSHTLTLSCLQQNTTTPMAAVQLRNLTAVFSANEL